MALSLRSITPATAALGILCLLIGYIVGGSILNHFKLRQFKGPPLAGLSRFWLFWQEVNARTHKAQAAALQNYGKSYSNDKRAIAKALRQARRVVSARTCLLPMMRTWSVT